MAKMGGTFRFGGDSDSRAKPSGLSISHWKNTAGPFVYWRHREIVIRDRSNLEITERDGDPGCVHNKFLGEGARSKRHSFAPDMLGMKDFSPARDKLFNDRVNNLKTLASIGNKTVKEEFWDLGRFLLGPRRVTHLRFDDRLRLTSYIDGTFDLRNNQGSNSGNRHLNKLI
jgi:hypothetical protein